MNLYEKIIDNPLFFKWVYNPDEYTHQWWNNYIQENPQIADDLIELKERLLLIKSSDEKLNEKEKKDIARNILKRTVDKKSAKRQEHRFLFLRYAAIAILFFALGGFLAYTFLQNRITEVKIPDIQYYSQINGPTLILPEGENVDLVEKESALDYTQNGKIIVNNNKVIEATKSQAENKINQLVIPYGNRSRIILSDNSVVNLNAGSRLIYPSVFSGSKREVLLFGEAFFEVKEDKDRPFIVKTTDLSVRVLGTKFNICAYPEDNVIQTVLTEGKISLRRNNANLFEDDIIVLPDQMALFNKKGQTTKIYEVDVSYYTLWKDGLLKFSDEDLSRVIKQLERFYNITFTFDNPLDGSIKISGKLDLKEEKEEVFEFISKVALVEIRKEKGNRYIIK